MRLDEGVAGSAMPCAERYLSVSPLREVWSAPSSRTCSFKNRRREAEPGTPMGGALLEGRPRTNSLPSWPGQRGDHEQDVDINDNDCRTKNHHAHSYSRLHRVR